MTSETSPPGSWVEAVQERPSDDNDWGTLLFLSIAFGWAGADRFYLGRHRLGIAKLCTFGGFAYWWFIDIFLAATGRMRDAQNRRVTRR